MGRALTLENVAINFPLCEGINSKKRVIISDERLVKARVVWYSKMKWLTSVKQLQ